MKCHQRKIRDKMMASDPRPVQTSLDGCRVEEISRSEAESIILVYEWLGTMPTAGQAFYGLKSPENELLGVACFGLGHGTKQRDICGEEYREKAIGLERGACVHWSHPHAPSFLVSQAVKQASKDHGWQIFYAYSDIEAGEIGTIYQACNWYYIGQSPGRQSNWRFQYIRPDGLVLSSRQWRAKIRKAGITWEEAEEIGWKRRKHYDKHKYVHFEGSKSAKRKFRKLLRYPVLDYPKRTGDD
jgi:hypothetical protein